MSDPSSPSQRPLVLLLVLAVVLVQIVLGLVAAPLLREPPALAASLTLGFVLVTAAGAPIDDDAVPPPRRRVHPLSPLERPASEKPDAPAPLSATQRPPDGE